MKQELIAKFENDMVKRTRVMRFHLVLDQMFNVLLYNGSQDETISSHIGRRIESGKAKQYLADTDHKFYNGYKPKVDEDLVTIELERDTAREFIRVNKGDI